MKERVKSDEKLTMTMSISKLGIKQGNEVKDLDWTSLTSHHFHFMYINIMGTSFLRTVKRGDKPSSQPLNYMYLVHLGEESFTVLIISFHFLCIVLNKRLHHHHLGKLPYST